MPTRDVEPARLSFILPRAVFNTSALTKPLHVQECRSLVGGAYTRTDRGKKQATIPIFNSSATDGAFKGLLKLYKGDLAAASRWCRGPTVALTVGKSRVLFWMRWVFSL